MKIAYVYQSHGTNFADPFAVQLHIYHQIRELQQAGHTVNLLALQGREVLSTGNLQVFHNSTPAKSDLGRLGLSGARAFKKVESAMRRIQKEFRIPYLALFDSYRTYDACVQNLQGFDVIHERYNLMSIGGALASRRLGLPYFLEVNADLLAERNAHGKRERGLRQWFAKTSTRYCFNQARRIICVSSQLKSHLIEKWQINADKIVVLPNAADVDTFGRQFNIEEIRNRFGLNNEPVVMFIGGFYLWHDLELLVESFGEVLKKVPDARLFLVGDGRTRAKVKQKIAEGGLDQAVVMAGAVNHHQVPEMLAMAAVAVAPNIQFFNGHGGSPLKIFEYMAAGKAIVATKTGQVAEILQDGHNAVLVEAGDKDGLAGAIIRLLTFPQERQRLGLQARRQAVERHSWKQYVKHLEQIYLASRRAT